MESIKLKRFFPDLKGGKKDKINTRYTYKLDSGAKYSNDNAKAFVFDLSKAKL
jgi:hypothetical protein